MEVEKICKIFLSLVLILSAISKLISVSYVTNILYLMLPVGWISTRLAEHLSLLVIAVSSFELVLGLLLVMDKSLILYILLGYLLLMLAVDSYQWIRGIQDCACFGSWFHIPPKVTFFKTLGLILLTAFLVNRKKEFTGLLKPVIQKQ